MRRRYKKGTGIGIISFVVLILCGIVTYSRIGLTEERSKNEVTIQRLQQQIDKQDERALEIDNYRIYVNSNQYIEDIARDKLGLVYKDEVIFKEKDPEE